MNNSIGVFVVDNPISSTYSVQEEWRKTKRHEGYEVSNSGRVRSYWAKGKHNPIKIDKPWILQINSKAIKGYVQVNLRGTVVNVHILVLEAFSGPRPVIANSKIEARHLNDNRLDNRAENLTWGTQLENVADAKRNNLIKLGQSRKGTKISEQIALEIRRLYGTGEFLQKDLAKKFNVTKSNIQNVVSGETWSYLPLSSGSKKAKLKPHKAEIVRRALAGEDKKSLAKEFSIALGTVYYMIHHFKEVTKS